MAHPWSGGRGGGGRGGGGRGGGGGAGGWRGGGGGGAAAGGGGRDAIAFQALAAADGLAKAGAYVSCDQYGPLIRMWIQGWDDIEVHLHLDALGAQAVAGNVRDKGAGRGPGAHGRHLSAAMCTALYALATAGGITEYHQELRSIGWRIGGAGPIPPDMLAANKGRFLPWGQANGENAIAAHAVYNPAPAPAAAAAVPPGPAVLPGGAH